MDPLSAASLQKALYFTRKFADRNRYGASRTAVSEQSEMVASEPFPSYPGLEDKSSSSSTTIPTSLSIDTSSISSSTSSSSSSTSSSTSSSSASSSSTSSSTSTSSTLAPSLPTPPHSDAPQPPQPQFLHQTSLLQITPVRSTPVSSTPSDSTAGSAKRDRPAQFADNPSTKRARRIRLKLPPSAAVFEKIATHMEVNMLAHLKHLYTESDGAYAKLRRDISHLRSLLTEAAEYCRAPESALSSSSSSSSSSAYPPIAPLKPSQPNVLENPRPSAYLYPALQPMQPMPSLLTPSATSSPDIPLIVAPPPPLFPAAAAPGAASTGAASPSNLAPIGPAGQRMLKYPFIFPTMTPNPSFSPMIRPNLAPTDQQASYPTLKNNPDSSGNGAPTIPLVRFPLPIYPSPNLTQVER